MIYNFSIPIITLLLLSPHHAILGTAAQGREIKLRMGILPMVIETPLVDLVEEEEISQAEPTITSVISKVLLTYR